MTHEWKTPLASKENCSIPLLPKNYRQVVKRTMLIAKELNLMACAKAIIFDYIGTLVNCKGYTMDASKENLYSALAAKVLMFPKNSF